MGLVAAAPARAQSVSDRTAQLGRCAALPPTHRDGACDQIRSEDRVRILLPLAVVADQRAGDVVVEGGLKRFEGDRRHDAGIGMAVSVPAGAKGWSKVFENIRAAALGGESQHRRLLIALVIRCGVPGRNIGDCRQSLAWLAAAHRQRTNDLSITGFKANFVAAVLGESHGQCGPGRELGDDGYAAAGSVLTTTFAAVGGVQGMGLLSGDRLSRKGFDLEVAFVPACGQAGRFVDRPLPVSAAEADGDGYPLVGSGQRSGKAACAIRAACKRSGSDLPRLLARRRIPVQAIGLKKYRCGIESVTTTCHKKHALAALGDTEILGLWIVQSYAQALRIDLKIQASVKPVLHIISDDDLRGMSPRKSEIRT